jgi:hypothetical protein
MGAHSSSPDPRVPGDVSGPRQQRGKSLAPGGAGERETPRAEGGAWIPHPDLVTHARRLPGWRRSFPFLLPGAGVFVLGALVGAYFGVPTALLNAVAVMLTLAHLWPSWRAREIAEFWTPAERYVAFELGPGGLRVSSAGAVREVPWEGIERVSRSSDGWFLWFRNEAPLWMPRSAFGEAQGEVIDAMFARLPTESVGKWLPWLWAVAAGGGVAGTALWYLSA